MRLVTILSSLSLLWMGTACATAVVEDDDGTDPGSGGSAAASGGASGIGGGLIGSSGGTTNGTGGDSASGGTTNGTGGDSASGGTTNSTGGSTSSTGGAPPVVTPSCENCKPWSDFSYTNLIQPGSCISHEDKTYSFMTPRAMYQAECPPAGAARLEWCGEAHGLYQACE